jgi:pimeloyl-ACP methyl ester carboxylesterase
MELFFRTTGSGEPLVILHGLIGMSDNWLTPAKRLASQFQCIMPDLRNHGNSPHSPDFSLELMADDLYELFQKLRIASAYVLGHSMGGRVALAFADKYPDLVRKLIIVDIAPRKYSGSKSIANLLEVMCRVDFTGLSTISEIDSFLKKYIPDDRVRFLVMKNTKRAEQGFEWKLNLPVIIENVEDLMTPVNENMHFGKPCLFIKGGKSDFITQEDITLIYNLFPQVQIEIIKNADHWVHVDAPEDFINCVERFLIY